MELKPEVASGEIKHLQLCINDLVSLLALPAMWSGGDPSQVLDTLLDALMRILRLNLVSVRLTDPAGEAPVEIVRIAEPRGPMPSAHEICEALSQCFRNESRRWPPLLRNLMGEGDVSIVPLPLGLQGELGVIVAAAERTDFPRQTEALLLSVAANQASIGLQEARLLSHQKRVASELDQRVVQRTAELAAVNDELKKELAERRLVEERLGQEERELKRSEVRKAAIVDAALDCIVTIDHEGCITEFNPAAEHTFGYRRDEVLGKHLADVIIPPSLREKHRQGFARYLATGEARMLGKRIEMTAVRADGSIFPVELAIARIPLEGPPSFTGYLRDNYGTQRGGAGIAPQRGIPRGSPTSQSHRQLFLACGDRRNHVVRATLSDLRARDRRTRDARTDPYSSPSRRPHFVRKNGRRGTCRWQRL